MKLVVGRLNVDPSLQPLHLHSSAVRLEGWIKRKDEHCKTIASLLLNLFEASAYLPWQTGSRDTF